jgi:hypothetical protein
MNPHFIITSLLLVGCVLSGQAQPSVFKRDQLVGSWRVNWQKSKPDAADTVSQVPSLYRQYEDSGDGWMLHTVIAVDPTQRSARLLVVAAVKYDGNQYPTFAGKRLASVLSSGTDPVQTVAFRVLDAYTMEWTDRTSGILTGTGTVALSQDGKTMTDTTRAFNPEGKQTSIRVLVYEKQ